MKIKGKLIFFLLILFLFLKFSIAEAEGLVPCGRPRDDPRTDVYEDCPCQFCHLLILIYGIIYFVLKKIVIPLAILFLIAGGIMFLTAAGKKAQISKARDLVRSVVIGLLIIFSAWALINTFLMAIGVAEWTGLREWWEINCPVPDRQTDKNHDCVLDF